MGNVKKFNHELFGELEVLIKDGKEWFPASEVAEKLGYKRGRKAIADHCRGEGVLKWSIPTNGGIQEKNFINEGNLYRLIVKSKLPEAEKFEKWVFDEVLPSIRKTGGFVANDQLFIETYLPYADETTKVMFLSTLQTVRKQNEIIEEQKKEIEYKEDVIINLVDEVTLAEKRQILNQVVRKQGFANISQRWGKLYNEFEMKYHCDLNRRLKTYNENNKPKLKNKLDYIDKVMNKIPELYEIACKLYENDVDELVKEMYVLNGK